MRRSHGVGVRTLFSWLIRRWGSRHRDMEPTGVVRPVLSEVSDVTRNKGVEPGLTLDTQVLPIGHTPDPLLLTSEILERDARVSRVLELTGVGETTRSTYRPCESWNPGNGFSFDEPKRTLPDLGPFQGEGEPDGVSRTLYLPRQRGLRRHS